MSPFYLGAVRSFADYGFKDLDRLDLFRLATLLLLPCCALLWTSLAMWLAHFIGAPLFSVATWCRSEAFALLLICPKRGLDHMGRHAERREPAGTGAA